MSFIVSNHLFTRDDQIQEVNDFLDSRDLREYFVKLLSNRPTLEEAIREAGIHDESVLKSSVLLSTNALRDPEISTLGLTPDEAGAISCYTLEKGEISPYLIINRGLVGSRNRALPSTHKLIFLLLSGLRKLPRFKVSAGRIYYRGMGFRVPQNPFEANGHQYYAKGKIVTWWGFTSTTTDSEAVINFINDMPQRTLFYIGGEKLWGYDIKKFSEYPAEGEILLEPETKVLVDSVVPYSNPLIIHLTFQPFDRLVLEDIIPVSRAFSTKKSISWDLSFRPITPKTNLETYNGTWKTYSYKIGSNKEYSVDVNNPRIATSIGRDGYCTIIGDIQLPLNRIISWNIRIANSSGNNGAGIYIGVAPFDINQNDSYNHCSCGWYFHCFKSVLFSGVPHNYYRREYGPRKLDGEYVHTGDSVGVVMDTTKGDLSFVVKGENLGVAYKKIPLDKPLVPCVILGNKGNSIELNTPIASENKLDSSIPVPSNITAKSDTWDSITLTWNAVGSTEFYQVEVDGSKFYTSTTSTFTKRGLLPGTDYCFRVRAVKKDNSVSMWSAIVKGKTQMNLGTYNGTWKTYSYKIGSNKEYSVDVNNPRIATSIGRDGDCTIIGDVQLPLNSIISWNIKILESRNNNGAGIYIGVAPFDINQNDSYNYYCCGWYFHCYKSLLFSGVPHKYHQREYGPRKKDGEYIHTGNSVGIAMDTAKGDLSFVLSGMNYGVAYKEIPLDRPLAPCVILGNKGDSVELF